MSKFNDCECNKCIVEGLARYVGRTVTLYTTSGGCSGDGFTGVLVSVDCDCVRLISSIGAPPDNIGKWSFKIKTPQKYNLHGKLFLLSYLSTYFF